MNRAFDDLPRILPLAAHESPRTRTFVLQADHYNGYVDFVDIREIIKK